MLSDRVLRGVHGPTVAVPADSLNGMSPLEALAADARGSSASEPIISITPEAIDQLRELRDDEAEADKLGLRLAIASAPGEDFRYDLSFDEYLKAAFTDEVRTHDGLKVIIPGNDVELLEGATLDYTSTQGLVIRNPNRPRPPMVEGLTSDDALSAEIEAMVAADVNPALAAHGGFVTYVGHDGDGTAYLTMGGGCHGCSMSKMTMLDGVQTMLVEAIDEIERVKDLTDHATGENPFYSLIARRQRVAGWLTRFRRRSGGTVFGGSLRGGSSLITRAVIAAISATARSNTS